MEQRLHDAAVAGDVTSLLQLIEEDPLLLDKVNLICQDKNPLHIAAMFGHVDFVRVILRDNFDMCLIPDRFGRNPLHLAAIKGRLDVLRELIHAMPLAAREKTAGGDTVLHLCIRYNQLEALKNLVETLQDHEFANMKNGDGMTMLHLAICNKQNETIEYLLRAKIVDVNALNANGNTALDLFQEGTNSEIARSLKTAGAKTAKEIAPRELKWLTKKRDALMVVASLIATMAFQAGISPPGGVWQNDKDSIDSKCSNDSIPRSAGQAVMACKNPDLYEFFIAFNTVAFVSSSSVILLLISGLPFKRSKFFMWALVVVMWMTVTTTAGTYRISITMVTPMSNLVSTVIQPALRVWDGVLALLLLGNTIRLLTRLLKFLVRLLKRWLKFLQLSLGNTIRLLNRWVKFLCLHLLNKIKHGNRAVQEQTNGV